MAIDTTRCPPIMEGEPDKRAGTRSKRDGSCEALGSMTFAFRHFRESQSAGTPSLFAKQCEPMTA
jgi:hypothetical protein